MKRRAERLVDGVPARLLEFRPEDSPGRSERARFNAWRAARLEYAKAHTWPGGWLDALLGAWDVEQVLFNGGRGRPPRWK